MKHLKKLVLVVGLVVGIAIMASGGTKSHIEADKDTSNEVYQSPKIAMELAINKYKNTEDGTLSPDKRRDVLEVYEYTTKEKYAHIDLGDISESSRLSEEKIKSMLPDNLKQLSKELYIRDNLEGPERINAIYMISQIKIFTGNGTNIYGKNLFGLRNSVGLRVGKLKRYNTYQESIEDYLYFLDKRIINTQTDSGEERSVAYICYRANFPYDWVVSTYLICIDLNSQWA